MRKHCEPEGLRRLKFALLMCGLGLLFPATVFLVLTVWAIWTNVVQ